MSKDGYIFKNLHTHHPELINVNIWHLLIEKKYTKVLETHDILFRVFLYLYILRIYVNTQHTK